MGSAISQAITMSIMSYWIPMFVSSTAPASDPTLCHSDTYCLYVAIGGISPAISCWLLSHCHGRICTACSNYGAISKTDDY